MLDKMIDFEPWNQKSMKVIAEQQKYQKELQGKNILRNGRNCFISQLAHMSGTISLGNDSYVAAYAVLRGNVICGSNCSVNVFTHIAGNVNIGNNVRIANNVNIFGFNHVFSDINKNIVDQGTASKGITINDNVWIGAGAVIVDGVTIGSGSIIGAGSVVTSSFPPFSVVGGNPAKLLFNRANRYFTEQKAISSGPASTMPHAVRDMIFSTSPYENFTAYRPCDLQGGSIEETIFHDLIMAIRPKLLVEVGTWKGTSAIHQANIVRKAGIACEIVCVDTWLGNWQHWSRPAGPWSIVDLSLQNGFPTIYNQFLSNVIFNKVDDIITPLPLPSLSAVKLFKHFDIRPDLVYIDADHEYEAVSQDLACWFERLAPGGILFGDDMQFPGVKKAVDEFSQATGLLYKEHTNNRYVFAKKPFSG